MTDDIYQIVGFGYSTSDNFELKSEEFRKQRGWYNDQKVVDEWARHYSELVPLVQRALYIVYLNGGFVREGIVDLKALRPLVVQDKNGCGCPEDLTCLCGRRKYRFAND